MYCAELWLDRARVQHQVKHSEYGISLMETELERVLLQRESQNFIISFLYKAGKKNNNLKFARKENGPALG